MKHLGYLLLGIGSLISLGAKLEIINLQGKNSIAYIPLIAGILCLEPFYYLYKKAFRSKNK